MSEAKKYFYLKVKETFFDSEEMKILESQKNGVVYQNLYLKLSLLSLKSEGALLFKDTIPYDETMISSILRVDIDTVHVGLEMFRRLNLVEVLDNGTMYMADIQAMIGRSSSEGERVKAYRERIKTHSVQPVIAYEMRTNVRKCTPELELELELELDKARKSPLLPYGREKKQKEGKHKHGEFGNVLLTSSELEKIKTAFPLDWEQRIKAMDEGIELKGYKYKSHYLAILKWADREKELQAKPKEEPNDSWRFHDPLHGQLL